MSERDRTQRLLQLYTAVFAGFLVMPVAVATLLSVSSEANLNFPPAGLSLRWYAAALSAPWFLEGVLRSLALAAASTLLAVVAGTGAALALNHYRFRGRAVISALMLMPLTLPAVVLGLGLLFLFGRLGLPLGFGPALVGHAVAGVPFVTYLVLSALSGYDLSLDKASASLGASPARTFVSITLPIIAPGIAAGAAFAFLMSFDNVSLSVFVTRGDTLPLRMMQQIQFYADPTVAAVSTIVVAISGLILWLAGRALRPKARASG